MRLLRTSPCSSVALFVAFAGALGCGGDDNGAGGQLPSFNDITTAPGPIRTAAAAVVRIRTANELATGSFITPTGQLLTNNHVLGVTLCPVEGCFIDISLNHQRGETPTNSQTVFGVPIAVDVGLDMALVQIYEAQGGAMLATPNYLSITPKDPASLLGQHVTVVGHPEGYLKKWTDGVVSDVTGNWFTTTAYSLPGDSGSPMLDDTGAIVGLLHRGAVGEDIIATNDVNVFSVGTASAPVLAAMAAPLPAIMISTAAETTEDKVVANDQVYLNARAQTALVDGAPVSILSMLGRACDAAVAREDFQSPDDLSTAVAPCYEGITWIDCRTDSGPASYGTTCPVDDDAAAWASRFRAVNQRRIAMNGQLDLYPISFGIAHLQTSMAAGYTAGSQSLQQVIDDNQPALDFGLANYLAAFDIPAYDGQTLESYVRNYRSIVHYELQSFGIASATLWLLSKKGLPRDQALSILGQLYGDASVSVGAKLYVEENLYGAGAL